MLEALWSGVAAGYGIAVPVGAIAVLIVGTAIKDGFATGAAAGAGAATADLLYALVAAFAGTAVSGVLEGKERAIGLVSAAVLVAIAGHGLWSLQGRSIEATAVPVPAALAVTYARFVVLTIVNPLTVVYFSSLVIGLRLGTEWTFATGAAFAVGAFAASLSWQLVLATLGAVGRHRLGARFRVAAVVGGNLVVLGFAAAIVVRSL
jgi:threonine/homoserine/homoserine lactone efflux protein